MLYTGPAFSAAALGDGIVELKFDLAGDSVNKLNAAALRDFDAATQAIARDSSVKGVIVTSGKHVFIVGADVTEFTGMFAAGEEAVAKGVLEVNRMLSRFEDLPVPTVAAINGICLGGGLEMALACDYRVMSTAAVDGLPRSEARHLPGLRRHRAHAAPDRRGQRRSSGSRRAPTRSPMRRSRTARWTPWWRPNSCVTPRSRWSGRRSPASSTGRRSAPRSSRRSS